MTINLNSCGVEVICSFCRNDDVVPVTQFLCQSTTKSNVFFEVLTVARVVQLKEFDAVNCVHPAAGAAMLRC